VKNFRILATSIILAVLATLYLVGKSADTEQSAEASPTPSDVAPSAGKPAGLNF
jgi:hypothetical protein